MFDGVDTTVQGFFVGQTVFPTFAERLRPAFAVMAAGSGGRYWAVDIEENIKRGIWQLWVAMDGPEIVCTMLTQIMDYPRLRAMRCIAVVGHRPRRWMHLLAHVEIAAKNGFACGMMEALHQAGHERLLRTGGWSTFHALSEKSL